MINMICTIHSPMLGSSRVKTVNTPPKTAELPHSAQGPRILTSAPQELLHFRSTSASEMLFLV
jgi:hypothetical protein